MTDRTAKYASCMADLINSYIRSNAIPEDKRDEFTKIVISEIKSFSYQRRKQGEPKNAGCIYELRGISSYSFNPANPKHLGKLIKEIAHNMFNKNRAQIFLEKILANI